MSAAILLVALGIVGYQIGCGLRRMIERRELMTRQRAFNNRVTRNQSNVWGDCEFCGSAVGEIHDRRCRDIRGELLTARAKEA